MTKPSKFLEPLAVAVASGNSIKTSAEIVGCSLQSAYNLSHTEQFRFRVSEIRSEITSEAVGIITRGATAAASTLVELLDPSNDARDRLASAKTILGVLAPMAEHAELRARLDRLEQSSSLRVVS
jgi:hypothetical protein